MSKAKMGISLIALLVTTSLWAENYRNSDITIGDHRPVYLMSKTQTLEDNYHYNESGKENERKVASEKEQESKMPKYWMLKDKKIDKEDN